jgi:hypothetical protein
MIVGLLSRGLRNLPKVTKSKTDLIICLIRAHITEFPRMLRVAQKTSLIGCQNIGILAALMRFPIAGGTVKR